MDFKGLSDPVVIFNKPTKRSIFDKLRPPSTGFFKNKKYLGGVLTVFLLFAVGLGVYLSQRPTQLTPQAASSLENGLISYWNFNETSGSAVADFKGTNNGTATGTTIVDGKISKARSFNGSSDFVNLGGSSSLKQLATAPFTVGVWINPTLNFGSKIIIANSNGGSTNNPGWYMMLASDNRIRFQMIINDATYTAALTAPLTPGWHHITGTWEGGTNVKTYVDGALNSTPLNGSSVGPIGNLGSSLNTTVGNAPAGSFYSKGIVDELGIWNRILTTQEISMLYNNGQGLIIPEPLPSPAASPSPSPVPSVDPSSCTENSQCTPGKICSHYQNYPGTCLPEDSGCAQVITRACNPQNSNECVDFPNPCVVPPGWIITPASPAPSPSPVASPSPSPLPSPSPSPLPSSSPSPLPSPSPNPSPSPVPSPSGSQAKGDGNNDGAVNLTDLSVLLNKWSPAITITSHFQLDFNDDGKINSFDHSAMNQMLLTLGIIRQ